MKIVVASGKGGVGKSTIISSLALLLSEEYKITLIDADVDCPDLQILFEGKEKSQNVIQTSEIAEIDTDKCTGCGLCEKTCKFDAVHVKDKKAQIDEFSCEGCGACTIVCPEDAIKLKKIDTGEIVHINTKHGFPLIYAQLFPGKPNSGMLVHTLRKKGEEAAKKEGSEVVLIDAAAGIGCPVIASLMGCDYMIGVVEPTTAAFVDLKRLLKVADYFKIPYSIVINKSGISEKNEKGILSFAKQHNIEILGIIPYDKKVIEALAERKLVILIKSKASDEIRKIAEKVGKRIK